MRVQGQHVPVRVKDRAGRSMEYWMIRDIEVIVKKEAVRSPDYLEKYRSTQDGNENGKMET